MISSGSLGKRSFLTDVFSMNNFRDCEQRPLGESHASKSVRSTVPMETEACPYSGGRAGLPMNVSALRQMTSRWPEILALLAEHHHGYLLHNKCSAPLQWRDVLGVCMASVCMPAYLAQRQNNPVADGEMPSTVAATYKVAIGAFSVLKSMLLVQLRDPENAQITQVDAETIAAFSERRGKFVGAEQACAGPPGLIAQALTQWVSPSSEPSPAALGLPNPEALFEAAACLTDQLLCAEAFTIIDKACEQALLTEASTRLEESGGAAPRDSMRACLLGQARAIASLPPTPDYPTIARALLNSSQRAKAEHIGVLLAWLDDDGQVDLHTLGAVCGDFRGPVCAGTDCRWVARHYVRYARLRLTYDAMMGDLEQRICVATGRRLSPVDIDDPQLYPRLNMHQWLETLAGVELDAVVSRLKTL